MKKFYFFFPAGTGLYEDYWTTKQNHINRHPPEFGPGKLHFADLHLGLAASSAPMATQTSIPAALDAAPANCKVVLAQSIAKKLLTEVDENLVNLGRTPILVGFLANIDPAARMYADWTAKTCKEKYSIHISPLLGIVQLWLTTIAVGSNFN